MMTAEQLKGSILQLAMQGKLVEQRPEEGTGEELYKEIIKERQRLVKEGRIKKDKGQSEKNEEPPFDIPESWQWAKLNDIVAKTIKRGKSPKYAQNSNTLVFAQKCNTKAGFINLSLCLFLDEKLLSKYSEDEYMVNEDIVINSTGNGTLGRVGVYRDSDNPNKFPIVPDSHVTVIRCSNLMDVGYVFYCLKYYQPYMEKLGSGSTNQTELGAGVLKELSFPIPPLAEQKRIVAKIEELMPFVEQYAAASTKLNTLNATFPEMMKKSILQEAVQGKLVPQDPNDEPASLLLKKIAEEKKRLIKEGKIKKGKYDYYVEHRKEGSFCVTHKGVTPIDEMIFDLPDNWTFCTLSELVQFIGGYAYKSNLFVGYSPYQVLRLGNVKNDSLKLDVNPVYITENLAKETQEFLVRHNDILLTMTGTRLKRDYFYTVCVDDSDNSLFVNQRVGCLRPYCSEMSKWLSYVLKSNYVLDFIFNHETGTANQGNLGAENIMKIIIPLPPINEQKRIVKMLDELTSINKDLLIGPLCE